MLDTILLVLFLIFVFRIVFAGLQKQPGSGAMAATAVGHAATGVDHGNVIEILKREQWEAELERGEKERKVIVVDFTATWCGPCRQIAPFFVELSKKYKDVIYLKVDVDAFADIAGKWEVQAMPTFIFIQNKKLVHKIVGSNKDELEKKSVQLSASHHT